MKIGKIGTNRGITAIIKPTHNCNLDCRYCYIEKSAEDGTMNTVTLENSIKKIIEYNNRIRKSTHFIWHGGEPLLMGVDFFRKVYTLVQKYRMELSVKNSIQSNGTLITDELIQFSMDVNDFNIGLSIDGPAKLHNTTRPYKNGKNSFDDVYRAIKRMKKFGYSKGIGVIVTLSQYNLPYMDELYSFFKENRINFKINPIITAGKARNCFENMAITPLDYAKAMIELFDLWFYEEEYHIYINPLAFIVGNIMTGTPIGCHFKRTCRNSFISIGPLGDVYPCGRFDGSFEFKLGNINKTNLEEIFASEVYTKLQCRVPEMIDECKQCEFMKICNAGCFHNALITTGSIMEKDNFCTGYKMIFRHINAAITNEINKIDQLNKSKDVQHVTKQEPITIELFGKKINVYEIKNPQLQKIIKDRFLNDRAFNISCQQYPDKEYSDYDAYQGEYDEYWE